VNVSNKSLQPTAAAPPHSFEEAQYHLCMNYSPLNDACWSSAEVKTETMLPLITAFKHWREWEQSHVKRTVEQIAIKTVKLIIAELDYLPEQARNQCRKVYNTATALEAAQAAWDIEAIDNIAQMKFGESGAIREAKWPTLDATKEASWAAAEAGWGAKRAEAATSSAARAAAYAAKAAMAEKTTPDNVLRAACQLWIEAAS
jgi:hypothetical protein